MNFIVTKKTPHSLWGRPLWTSVLFGQHDRQHTGDDGFSIAALDFWLLTQIDLKKDGDSIDVERSEVVFFLWLVGLAEGRRRPRWSE